MSSDFADLIAEFSARDVEFLVVGAHAVAAHGHVRATKDLDLWIRPSPENARKVMEALVAFGAALFDLTEEDLATPGVVFQLGTAPVRIDLITRATGLEFDEAWASRVSSVFQGQPVNLLSLDHLLVNKRQAGRLQDLADVEALERLHRLGGDPESGSNVT
jgi:hypothetical protein